MDIDQVLRHIHPEAIARDAFEFVKVQSETGTEGDGSLFLADLLRREGFDVEMEEVEPHRPNVYAFIPGAAPRWKSLLLNGHVDTIPVRDCDAPALEGDWVIGRGAEDMKGGLVAMVHAASALRQAGVRLAGDLWLTGVIGHEAPEGKKEGPNRLIQHLRAGKVRADAVLIAEGPCAIWAASLGSTIFTITMTSNHGVIHTIKVPYADNPACWLGKLLTEFERLEQRFATAPAHPLCGREQLNVGMVRAGDYFNRLPTPITVSGTWRWMPGKTHDEVAAELRAICDRFAEQSGLSFTILMEGLREPFETPPDHPIIRAVEAAGETLTGKKPEVIGMALVGDAGLYANNAGVPSVYYGPAHETAHSDHERVSVSQLTHCAKVYALAATTFCGVAG